MVKKMLLSHRLLLVCAVVCFIIGLIMGSMVISKLFNTVENETEKTLLDAFNNGFAEGNNTGFAQGYKVGFNVSGFNVRDPTYSEALSFVASDKTNFHKYNMFSYCCFHFCRDFLNNAFNSGLKAGFVYVEFETGAHGLVCFDTVDNGRVFVEPQNDMIVELEVGQVYSFVEAPNEVIAFNIIW